MANMSYCRFENTLGDLMDCRDALDNGRGVGELSDRERKAALELIRQCKDISGEYGYLVDGHEEER